MYDVYMDCTLYNVHCTLYICQTLYFYAKGTSLNTRTYSKAPKLFFILIVFGTVQSVLYTVHCTATVFSLRHIVVSLNVTV